ncbi:MAG: Arc family DNA-binding protein [Lachnospiraceae bacterium]|nr:Arc family DNA-binding protein [Lachnospiraceae bacterium]
MDNDTHEKLKEMADYDGRSINGEVLYLIRQAIKKYEAETK